MASPERGEPAVQRGDHPVQVAAFEFVGADIAAQLADGQCIRPGGQPVQFPGLSDDLRGDQSPLIRQSAAEVCRL